MAGKRPPGPGRGNKIKMGSGIPAGGLGWGGPPKGEGSPKPSRPIGKEGAAAKIAIPPEVRRAKAARKAATREEMLDFYVEVKRDKKEPTALRMAAAEKWQDRTEGKPPQTNLNTNTTDMRVTVVLKG